MQFQGHLPNSLRGSDDFLNLGPINGFVDKTNTKLVHVSDLKFAPLQAARGWHKKTTQKPAPLEAAREITQNRSNQCDASHERTHPDTSTEHAA